MAHRNVGFLEARKIVEKWSQPWWANPAFSSGAESLRGYAEPNMKNFPILKMARRRRVWNNTETSESNKALSQPIRWNPGIRQWKMPTDNNRTRISETSPNYVEKRNSSKDQTVLENLLMISSPFRWRMKSRTNW
jgi:hypothetical protein